MDSNVVLVELHQLVTAVARFLLMVCAGMFLAYWQFTGLTLFAAVLRRRPRLSADSVPATDLYPATRVVDRVLTK